VQRRNSSALEHGWSALKPSLDKGKSKLGKLKKQAWELREK